MSYTKTQTKTKSNIRTMEDIRKDESDDEDEQNTEKYLLECITEIEALNKTLTEEKNRNETNEYYIKNLEEEYKILGEKYKSLNIDLKQLEEHKKISRMTDKKIKDKIKEKLGTLKETPYNKLSIEELRKLSIERINKLKKLNNIDI